MKKFIFLLLISASIFAQKKGPQNTVKLNVSGLGIKMLGVSFERKINKSLSFNQNVFFRPKVLIPFGNIIDKVAKNQGVGLTGIKFEYIFLDQAKVGFGGYSPELRWYLGKKKKTVLGVFAQYEKFAAKVPASLPVRTSGYILEVTTPINFNFQTISGGISIGRKFSWDKISAEFIIIAPHPGIATGFDVNLQNESFAKFTADDKQFIKEKLQERFGVADKYFQTDITNQGAFIKSIKPVPYFGIKGLIVNLGYSF
jgi:hypothetical protein